MDTKERREQILSLLAESAIPVSASKLAARFDVSRQIRRYRSPQSRRT